MRRWDQRLGVFLLLLGAAGFLLTGTAALRAQAALADQVIRIHIVAASDAPEDQLRKLLVRDRVLAALEPLLADCATEAEAEERLLEHLAALTATAETALRETGRPEPVTASLATEFLPTRNYDGFSLPAGRYRTLRLVIGPGAGRNWWCVAFPPLCLAAVSDSEDLAALGLDPASASLAADGCTIRFRCVELWDRLQPEHQPTAT